MSYTNEENDFMVHYINILDDFIEKHNKYHLDNNNNMKYIHKKYNYKKVFENIEIFSKIKPKKYSRIQIKNIQRNYKQILINYINSYRNGHIKKLEYIPVNLFVCKKKIN